jgi:hypothetical protein
MDTPELNQAFLAGDYINGVRFKHNDYVLVWSGSHIGTAGSLVSLLSLEPEPTFIIELESGQDAEVIQADIQLAEA